MGDITMRRGQPGTYGLRERSRTGIGKADTFEVVWASAEGRTSVLTTHLTREGAEARLAYMRAPLGSPERDDAYKRWFSIEQRVQTWRKPRVTE